MRFTLLSSLTVLLLALSLPVHATIFHINNQTGTPDGSNGIYEDPQDAHDAAFTGDTLLIDGSQDEYNFTLNVNKRLVIMGPGYFQDENPNTNNFPASIWSINLNRASGGDASSGAAGTIIQGLNVYGDIEVNVNDVLIRKNLLEQVDFGWSSSNPANRPSSVVISQNFFTNESFFGSHIYVANIGYLNGVVFRSNIFEGEVSIPEFCYAHFFNNVFLSQQIDIQNLLGTVRNNVFFSTNATYSLSADSITHNISMGSGLPSGNGNILNANPGQVFVLNAGVNGSDGQYRFSNNSIALGAGYNGADIGPYGGVTPYVRYGYGEMPVIWAMSTSGVIDPGFPLQVSIWAVSEN